MNEYARLEERILLRDQQGASDVFFGLVKDGRPLNELLLEASRTTSASTMAWSSSSTTTIACSVLAPPSA